MAKRRRIRFTGPYADPNAEPVVTVKPPASLKGDMRNAWIRLYIARVSTGIPPAEARKEANARARHSAKFIKAERDPKNKPVIPPRSKSTKPGQWKGA